jgi:RNA polymerase sigma-70 factor (TIGR02943 family)
MPQPLPSDETATERCLPPPEEWPARYGDILYAYALKRLRRTHEAEEAVQETLLAALRNRGQFQQRSSPRTWLIGILRRKILDRLRTAARQAAETDPAELDAWFDATDHWRKTPRDWGDPAAFAQREDFWRVLRGCLDGLPSQMAAAFTLRTMDEVDAKEVCQELAISPNNLWVLLHRARLRLMSCLQSNWFDSQE